MVISSSPALCSEVGRQVQRGESKGSNLPGPTQIFEHNSPSAVLVRPVPLWGRGQDHNPRLEKPIAAEPVRRYCGPGWPRCVEKAILQGLAFYGDPYGIAPFSPGAIVIANLFKAQQIGKNKPCVAAALADATIRNNVITRAQFLFGFIDFT